MAVTLAAPPMSSRQTLTNANESIEFTPPGPRCRLSVQAEGATCRISFAGVDTASLAAQPYLQISDGSILTEILTQGKPIYVDSATAGAVCIVAVESLR